jgi:hypothetical protein
MSGAKRSPRTISLRWEPIRAEIESLCHEADRHLHARRESRCNRVTLRHLKELSRRVACVDG